MCNVIDGELLGSDYLGPYVEPKGRAGTERELTTNSSRSSILGIASSGFPIPDFSDPEVFFPDSGNFNSRSGNREMAFLSF